MKTLDVGGQTLVMDDDVYDFLKDKTIEFTGDGYPILSLHRMLFPRQERGMLIDHKNRNKLDFQRHNLRAVTYAVNNRNRSKSKGCSSAYLGVKAASDGSWSASIQIGGECVFLGRWDLASDAARAFDVAVLFFFPEQDICNFQRSTYTGLDLKAELYKITDRLFRNNTSGYVGAFPTRNGKRFSAHAKINGKTIHLGTFDTAEEASYEHFKHNPRRKTRLLSLLQDSL